MALLAAVLPGIPSSDAAEKLSKSDRRWLDQEVSALITEKETQIFTELNSQKDRKLFKELFWARRDPVLMTLQNEFKEEYGNRVRLANRYFNQQRGRKGSTTDMAKVFLLLGSPAQTERSRRSGPGDRSILQDAVALTTSSRTSLPGRKI